MSKFQFDYNCLPKQNNRKKIFIICMLVFFLILTMIPTDLFSHDENMTNAEETLTNNVFDQLNNLDFTQVEQILKDLQQDSAIFGGDTFKEKIEKIVNGTYFTDYSNFFTSVIEEVKEKIGKFLPLIFTILGIALLNSFISSFKNNSNQELNNIINFVTFAVIILMLSYTFKSVIETCQLTLGNIKQQIDAIMPIMLTLLTAIGGVTSVGIYKPIIAILSGGITTIFSTFISLFAFPTVLFPLQLIFNVYKSSLSTSI